MLRADHIRQFLRFNDFHPQQSIHYIPPNSKGLENKFGQNNCFLNVVIQALWQIRSFREKFNSWEKHTHKGDQKEGNCVFCALKSVFIQYQYSETPLIPPTTLREALHHSFAREARFQIGEMDDAAETLEAIMGCLQEVNEDDDSVARMVFGIDTQKTVHCALCNSTSAPEITTNFIEYTYFSLLSGLKQQYPQYTLEDLLRVVAQEWKGCPREDKSVRPLCPEEVKYVVNRKLLNVPEVLAVGIVWETTNPSVDQILQSLNLITNEIDIKKIFVLDHPTPIKFRFRGMICYYGKHYACYFFDENLAKWIVFDDATVKVVGDWNSVILKAKLGHFHPSVLLFERNPNSVVPPRVKVVVPQPQQAPPPVSPLDMAELGNSLKNLLSNSVMQPPKVTYTIAPSQKKGYSTINVQKQDAASPYVKKGYSIIPRK